MEINTPYHHAEPLDQPGSLDASVWRGATSWSLPLPPYFPLRHCGSKISSHLMIMNLVVDTRKWFNFSRYPCS